jgi:hypothetical protein
VRFAAKTGEPDSDHYQTGLQALVSGRGPLMEYSIAASTWVPQTISTYARVPSRNDRKKSFGLRDGLSIVLCFKLPAVRLTGIASEDVNHVLRHVRLPAVPLSYPSPSPPIIMHCAAAS